MEQEDDNVYEIKKADLLLKEEEKEDMSSCNRSSTTGVYCCTKVKENGR